MSIVKQYIISCHIVLAEYSNSKRYHRSSYCGPVDANHSKRYHPPFFNPERYDEYPCPFYKAVPPLQALTMLRDFKCLNIGLLSKQFISCDLWRVSKLINVRFSTVLKILLTRFFMLTKFLSFSYCKASQAAHVA